MSKHLSLISRPGMGLFDQYELLFLGPPSIITSSRLLSKIYFMEIDMNENLQIKQVKKLNVLIHFQLGCSQPLNKTQRY